MTDEPKSRATGRSKIRWLPIWLPPAVVGIATVILMRAYADPRLAALGLPQGVRVVVRFLVVGVVASLTYLVSGAALDTFDGPPDPGEAA